MREQREQRPVALVGCVPRPIGGVAQHVWRLAIRAGKLCDVFDLHPEPGKFETGAARLHVAPRFRGARLPWLLSQIMRSDSRVVHLNLSSLVTCRLLRLGFFAACGSRRRVLTLHHGDQARFYKKMGVSSQKCVRQILGRFDCLVALSQRQEEFYHELLGEAAPSIVRAHSHVNLPDDWGTIDTPDAFPRKPGVRRLVAGGYPAPWYRHEAVIDLVDRLRRDEATELLLCLYGESSDVEYERQIRCAARARPWIRIIERLDFHHFLALLRSADVYVRPTTIDSYGLAVADALSVGTPVVASDVCERDPAAVIFPADDLTAFEDAVRCALVAGCHGRVASAKLPTHDGFGAIWDAYELAAAADQWHRVA